MKKYPFKFLDSYRREDRGVFFGRDEEIKALYDMVFQSSIVLVYGASGTGKTSLINCGLASKFEPHDWYNLMIRRGSNINDSLEMALNNAGGNMARTSEGFNLLDQWEDDSKTNIEELIPVCRSLEAIYQKYFRPIYLIFDQFEELFILGTSKEQNIFINTVQDILQSEQPVKLIFSIREEYLGHLFEFEREVPQLLRKKLRIEPMNLEKVNQVVIGVSEYEDSNIKIKEGEYDLVAEGIFEKVKGSEKSLTIQLPFLQVFLDKFYLKVSGDKNRTAEAEFNIENLNEMGEIGDVLINFLEEQVTSITTKLGDKYQNLTSEAIWKILSPFSTLEGTKEPISIQELYNRLPNLNSVMIDDVVEAFIQSRILRYNEGTETFEIAHDALAKPIAEKRSVEDNTLLEIKRLINGQVTVKKEAREYFTEKQLGFIEPYLIKIIIDDEEKDWISKSRNHLHEQKELYAKKHQEELNKTRQRRVIVYSLFMVLIALGFSGNSWYKAEKKWLESKKKADESIEQIKISMKLVDSLVVATREFEMARDSARSLINDYELKMAEAEILQDETEVLLAETDKQRLNEVFISSEIKKEFIVSKDSLSNLMQEYREMDSIVKEVYDSVDNTLNGLTNPNDQTVNRLKEIKENLGSVININNDTGKRNSFWSRFRNYFGGVMTSNLDNANRLKHFIPDTIINHLNDTVIQEYELNTPLRLAHFLAQIANKSKDFTDKSESLNYLNKDALMSAGLLWKNKNINKYADEKNINKITELFNDGIGLASIQVYFKEFYEALIRINASARG